MPNASLAEAKATHGFFPLINHAQFVDSHRRSVRNARGETRRCRLIPCRQTNALGKFPNIRLGHLRFDQWTANLEFTSSLSSRTVVTGVVEIIAVDDVTKAALQRNVLEFRIQLVLAEVATVRWILNVIRVRHLFR